MTNLAMLAFADDSLRCRTALEQTGTDVGSFKSPRLIAGGGLLAITASCRKAKLYKVDITAPKLNNWPSHCKRLQVHQRQGLESKNNFLMSASRQFQEDD